MPPDPDARLAASDWIEKARGDLEAARTCIVNPRVPTWVSGFHLQQACEKCLKGLLVMKSIDPPRTHDLAVLHKTLVEAGGSHPLEPRQIGSLQPFAIDERYPLIVPREASTDEVASLIPTVEAIVKALDEAINTSQST